MYVYIYIYIYMFTQIPVGRSWSRRSSPVGGMLSVGDPFSDDINTTPWSCTSYRDI